MIGTPRLNEIHLRGVTEPAHAASLFVHAIALDRERLKKDTR